MIPCDPKIDLGMCSLLVIWFPNTVYSYLLEKHAPLSPSSTVPVSVFQSRYSNLSIPVSALHSQYSNQAPTSPAVRNGVKT